MNILALIFSLVFLSQSQVGQYRLAVSITGLKPLKGELYISLHNRPEYFQVADSAFMKTKIAVKADSETVIFSHVPAGKYAVAVYHDENLNGKLDANEKGIPLEGYGFSTRTKMPGRPKFEQAEFEVNGNDTIEVKMIYHGSSDKIKVN